MKNFTKKLCSLLLVVISLFTMIFLSACGNQEKKLQEFYDTVVVSQECLDELADDIYTNWYNAIYKDKHSGNINKAILAAQQDNAANLTIIEGNDEIIQEIYKEVRDSDLSSEVKAVMSAYSDYYEFVVNVSGSFNSYSADKETLKKELASALKDLALEL